MALPAQAGAKPNEPVKEFGLWSAFTLGFSNISPILGIYSVFSISLMSAGPAFLWSLPLVLVGQLLVACVFGELVSRWPFQGSVYAWASQLGGARYGWFANWAYIWGMVLSLTFLALASAGYLLSAIGVNAPSEMFSIGVALLVLAFGSFANMVAGRFLKTLLTFTLCCELTASAGIGTALLLFHHVNPFSILFSGGGTNHGSTGHWLVVNFTEVVAFAGYSICGFEIAGSIAEEVVEARRAIPKAMILALAAVGGLVIYACTAIILAIPNFTSVMSGNIADPISSTLISSFGPAVGRASLIVLAVGFTSGMIAVQTALSRTVWATARDNIIPGATFLVKLSGQEHLPRRVILLTALISGALLFINTTKLYSLLISFSNVGYYICYSLPVLGLIYARRRGAWEPGAFSLGRWSNPVAYAAAAWLILEAINEVWPRPLSNVWYLNWGVLIMLCILTVVGLIICTKMVKNDASQREQSKFVVSDSI
ncbi:amino acid transporter [Acidocella aminolytica 101 = DSM 11237]|nr:amino acid transporter [Acidocella aminolytica 101 = DSM 11237]